MRKPSDIPCRIATYCRVSTKSQGATAINTQKVEIDKYLLKNNLPPATMHYEDQMTARKDPRKDPRPGHNQMKLDAQTHQFDTLVVWRLDRLARSVKNAAEWIDICQKGNIRLIFVADDMTVDHSPVGKMLFNMLAVMAQFFADMQQTNREAGQAIYWNDPTRYKKGGRPRKYNHKTIAAYYAAGHTAKETSLKYGVSVNQLSTILRKEGVSRYPARPKAADPAPPLVEAENE